MATSFEAFRNYVLSGTESVQQAPEGQVRIDVISEVLNGNVTNSSNNWKNFPLTLTIAEFKKKLEMFAGTQPQYQRLQLFDKDNQLFVEITDDSKLLSDYKPENGMKIFIIDMDPSNTVKNLQDTSAVEKYILSEEAYSKKEGTYKKWKEQQKKDEKKEESPEHIHVGIRCEVEPATGGDLKRRGIVMYVGELEGSSGFWVGVKLDEPIGKNDGSVKGKRYFECLDKYGVFVKPHKVTIGDFPEEDPFADEM